MTDAERIEQNCRLAFATWNGVISLGREYRMTESDREYWRQIYAPALGEQDT